MNMALSEIEKHLKTLRLHGMISTLPTRITQANQGDSFAEVFACLVQDELDCRSSRLIERRFKASGLKERPTLTEFDWGFNPKLPKKEIYELVSGKFITDGQDALLIGSPGTGKSHIAKALLLLACQKVYSCRYVTASGMLRDLLSGLADDSLDEKLKVYVRPQVLLIDEIGFDRLEQESSRNASLFFKVIEGRYCKQSTILTTNINFAAMGKYLGDPVVTAAMVDRMVHHAVIINIDGPSYRMHESKSLNRSSRGKPVKPK